MKISYENTIDNIVAFNRFHCASSPYIRRVRIVLRVSLAALALALSAAAAFVLNEASLLGAGALVAIASVILIPGFFQRSMDRQARRMYVEGANKDFLGPHELELSGEYLIERTPFGESRVRLEVVERVASDGRYTFIYIGAVMAHVIPHDAVTTGDRKALVDAVRRHLNSGPT